MPLAEGCWHGRRRAVAGRGAVCGGVGVRAEIRAGGCLIASPLTPHPPHSPPHHTTRPVPRAPPRWPRPPTRGGSLRPHRPESGGPAPAPRGAHNPPSSSISAERPEKSSLQAPKGLKRALFTAQSSLAYLMRSTPELALALVTAFCAASMFVGRLRARQRRAQGGQCPPSANTPARTSALESTCPHA